jgi:hypothetical protein
MDKQQQQQQQQQQQVVQQAQLLPGVPQLAVVLAGAQLPPAALLAAFKPLLQSKDHPKCMFESKRAYTELHHQGIHLAGVRGLKLSCGGPLLQAYWQLGHTVRLCWSPGWLHALKVVVFTLQSV